jgi:hypothetical protein
MVIGIVLSGIGLGGWAKKTGRSVLLWSFLAVFPPFFGPIIGLIVILIKGHKVRTLDSERPVNIYTHVVAASVLLLLSAFVMDSLSLAFFAFLGALIVIAVQRDKSGYTGKMKLIVIGIYAVMLIMAIAIKGINNRISYRNASVIIATCEQYKNKNGTYPARLHDLLPNYLESIPVARYTGTGEWTYFRYTDPSGKESYRLIFIQESLFGRRVYNSKYKKWHSLD